MNRSLEDVIAVVLAGGLGRRIRDIHPGLPKPMIPAAGRPFLEWVLRYLRAQGLRHAVISSGYRAEVLAAHFATQPVSGLAVQCVAENAPLGTAGGFLHAVEAFRQTPPVWLVLNGDSLVLADLRTASQPLADPETKAVILGIEVPETTRYGKLCFDPAGRLERFAEKEPGRGVVNAGVYFFKHELLARFPSSRPLQFEQDVFPRLLSEQVRIQVQVASGPFLDIGTPESLPLAGPFIANNQSAFQSP